MSVHFFSTLSPGSGDCVMFDMCTASVLFLFSYAEEIL